jgi:hypothetical protein
MGRMLTVLTIIAFLVAPATAQQKPAEIQAAINAVGFDIIHNKRVNKGPLARKNLLQTLQ